MTTTAETDLCGAELTDPCRECGRLLPAGCRLCVRRVGDDAVFGRWAPLFKTGDRAAAVVLLCARIDATEEWARDIDREYAHRWADACGAVGAVEQVWDTSIPGEDDGPVVLACYARALFAAVAEAADAIAERHDHDPRDARRYGWDCALIVPAALAGAVNDRRDAA